MALKRNVKKIALVPGARINDNVEVIKYWGEFDVMIRFRDTGSVIKTSVRQLRSGNYFDPAHRVEEEYPEYKSLFS